MERVYYDATFVSIVKLMSMQKHESALEGGFSDVIDCDVELHYGFQAT